MAVQYLFSDDDIKNQLKCLGYSSLPEPYFQKFKEDLMKLIEHDETAKQTTAFSERASTSASPLSSGDSFYARKSLSEPSAVQVQEDDNIPNSLRLLRSPYAEMYMESSSSNECPLMLYNNTNDDIKMDSHDSSDKSVNSLQLQNFKTLINKSRLRVRKVLRKKNGVIQISEETRMPSESDIAALVSDEIKQLSLTSNSNEDMISNCSKKTQSCGEIYSYPSKSHICPDFKKLHEPGWRKEDPVNKYHKYNRVWKTLKFPGQELHKNICWRVRERMLYPDIPVIAKKSAPLQYNF